MPSSCTICNHADRAEIENAILTMTADAPPNERNSIEAIAEQYKLPLDELKMHALFHTPLVGDGDIEELHAEGGICNMPICGGGDVCSIPSFDPNVEQTPKAAPRGSLTRKMKLREADMLAAVGQEYLVTLKTMGRRINKLAQVSSIDIEDEEKQLKLAKLLTKPMVDLYVGLGGEIRQTVKTMAELDRMLNGPEDNLSSGLGALAAAIRGSDGLNG